MEFPEPTGLKDGSLTGQTIEEDVIQQRRTQPRRGVSLTPRSSDSARGLLDTPDKPKPPEPPKDEPARPAQTLPIRPDEGAPREMLLGLKDDELPEVAGVEDSKLRFAAWSAARAAPG